MTVQDDVATVGFSTETALGPAEIRGAGRRAAAASSDWLATVISESVARGCTVRYVARGPGGLVRQMVLQLRWEKAGAGRRRVCLSVEDYHTEQWRVLSLPVGPRTVPALPAARRFAAALATELAGVRAA